MFAYVWMNWTNHLLPVFLQIYKEIRGGSRPLHSNLLRTLYKYTFFTLLYAIRPQETSTVCFTESFKSKYQETHGRQSKSIGIGCDWLPHITALTCQKVLNSSNQRFTISWSDKISFGLKDKIIARVNPQFPNNKGSRGELFTAECQRWWVCVFCMNNVLKSYRPPSRQGPQPLLLQSEVDGDSSHLRQSQRCMGCTRTH